MADECLAILDLYGCWVANNTLGCMKCVEELNDELKRLRCTPREEAAYCGGPEPIPAPVSQPCKNGLIKACEPYGGNHGTVRECDKCTLAANITSCTQKEELSFCLPALPFKPSETSCEHHLKKACEMEQKNPKACIACVKKAAEPPGSTNCSHREEEVFCAHHPLPPGPVPAPPPPGPATAKFSCNDTLGVCYECPPDDPEKPPWAQKCKQFTFNRTACAEACFKPTPPGQHWVCNTETHQCEVGPFEPHFKTHLQCENSCRKSVSGFTCRKRNGHASCERTPGGDHKTIAECKEHCKDEPGYHGYTCNATSRTCEPSSLHNTSSESQPSTARPAHCLLLYKCGIPRDIPVTCHVALGRTDRSLANAQSWNARMNARSIHRRQKHLTIATI